MNAIAELRKNNMMAFKKLDEDIIEFAGHPMNNQVSCFLNVFLNANVL